MIATSSRSAWANSKTLPKEDKFRALEVPLGGRVLAQHTGTPGSLPSSHSDKTEKQFRSPAHFTSSIARRGWGQHPQGRCQTSHGFHLVGEEVVFRGHSLSSVLTASHCLSSGFPQTQPGSAHLLVCLFIVYLLVRVTILFRGLI